MNSLSLFLDSEKYIAGTIWQESIALEKFNPFKTHAGFLQDFY